MAFAGQLFVGPLRRSVWSPARRLLVTTPINALSCTPATPHLKCIRFIIIIIIIIIIVCLFVCFCMVGRIACNDNWQSPIASSFGGGNFTEFSILIAICQNKTHQFEPLCHCAHAQWHMTTNSPK